MTELPKILKPYLRAARNLLDTRAVIDVQFSGPTYQILVQEDPDEEGFWAFLQLEDTGAIKDCFCGCEISEETGGCRHLAVAYLKIYNGHPEPLHIRFERSLWHKLCAHYAEKIGYDVELLKPCGLGCYEFHSISNKLLLSLKGTGDEGKAQLHQIMEMRIQETEETSLKFSNLPQDEIQLWREGRPSLRLLYHLSFWNDLAKWMMALQEYSTYELTFGYASDGIPNAIKSVFNPLEVFFYIPQALLPSLIPALGDVRSPIEVHDFAKEAIASITYDEEKGCLCVHRVAGKKGRVAQQAIASTLTSRSVMRLGAWSFSPDVGFFHSAVGSLLGREAISGHEISKLLQDQYLFVKEKAQGVDFHDEALDVSYHLSFDEEWNLYIRAYLFEPGDLQALNSHYFGEWAYLSGDGFYRLRNMRGERVEERVPAAEVSDFVSQNRIWLSGQEGFSPHLANVEAELAYSIDSEGNLHFSTFASLDDQTEGQKDFGRWIYIAGQGFFSKVGSHIGLPVRPGVVVNADSVGLFIHMNHDELQLVPHFFSDMCPILRSELRVELTDELRISVTPSYEIQEAYRKKKLKFYGDYVYTPGEGFYHLPAERRLPEEYHQAMFIDQDQEPIFLNFELDRLAPFLSYLDPRLSKPQQMELIVEEIDTDPQAHGWYKLRLVYATDKDTIPLTQIWKAISNKERFLYSSAGLIDLHDSRYAWLRSLAKQRVDLRRAEMTLSTMELIRLNIFDEIKATSKQSDKADEARKLLHGLMAFEDPEKPDITGLNSTLRPYQSKGVDWLWFLYHHGLSGMLCDDMGLGKTHQSMALIAAILNDLKHKGSERKGKFLIVCPTSVIYHWEEKLHDFLPGIRVHIFYGLERSLDGFDEDCEVLLTSYGIWRREVQRLKEIKFDLAVFDEVQAAKNQASRLHQTLLHVQAAMRLGLTGTPIENHLSELKALFDVVLPTYMPPEREFREFFIKPIEKEQDTGRRQLLSRLIKPFMLRRKKEDVLTDLPEKTEEIFHCELSAEQRKLYREVLDQGRGSLIDDLKDGSKVVPYVHIFAILTQLKRICNHPAVFLKVPSEYRKHESGKWDLFVELLSEARDSGQKVVVFSQYLAMLDIFEEYLQSQGIRFASVRGSTVNRGEQLQMFNQDPTCEVFLGSLQAVGLGVDLTAASVVIHYDRWWNAARENQATDRVHRIGQTRGVQVFKLVTKGTFEERIDALINAKGQLMEDVVGADDQDVVKRLDRQELIQLLQYVDEAAAHDLPSQD